jgi:CBS domain-containing protein
MGVEQVGALLAVDERQELVGVLSERDVIYTIARRKGEALNTPVRQAMSDPWLAVTPDTTVLEVMRVMTEERVRHLPVTSGPKLLGIVSIGDVLKSRLAEMQLEIAVLRDVARAYRSVVLPS